MSKKHPLMPRNWHIDIYVEEDKKADRYVQIMIRRARNGGRERRPHHSTNIRLDSIIATIGMNVMKQPPVEPQEKVVSFAMGLVAQEYSVAVHCISKTGDTVPLGAFDPCDDACVKRVVPEYFLIGVLYSHDFRQVISPRELRNHLTSNGLRRTQVGPFVRASAEAMFLDWCATGTLRRIGPKGHPIHLALYTVKQLEAMQRGERVRLTYG